MGELINGRTPEKVRFNISECSRSNCLSECPYEHQPIESCAEGLLSDALALIERLESERDAALAKVPKWISVEERLPKEAGKYIVCTRKKAVYCTAFRSFHGKGYFATDTTTHITHWMPLPEPPKEGE